MENNKNIAKIQLISFMAPNAWGSGDEPLERPPKFNETGRVLVPLQPLVSSFEHNLLKIID